MRLSRASLVLRCLLGGCILLYLGIHRVVLVQFHNLPISYDALPTEEEVSSKISPTTSPTPSPKPNPTTRPTIDHVNKGDNTTKFWRYDEAGPRIVRAKTHYLRSIPEQHRLSLLSETNDEGESVISASMLRKYSENPQNIYPHKLHLHETNPSIVALPQRYYIRQIWKDAFMGHPFPFYVVSYRITHHTNCYDPELAEKLFDGQPHRKEIPQTDYLGIALIDGNLKIVLDTVVDLKDFAAKPYRIQDGKKQRIIYNDYRLFVLRGELYLSTMMFLFPIRLRLVSSCSSNTTNCHHDSPPPTKGYIKLPFAFETTPGQHTISKNGHSIGLEIYLRDYPTCCVGAFDWRKHPEKKGNNKNLLYFDDSTNGAKALFFPRHNPNDVRKVDLSTRCDTRTRRKKVQHASHTPNGTQPIPTFHTMDEYLYPNHTYEDLWMADRGSACCTRLKRSSIIPARSNNATTRNNTTSKPDSDFLLVAIVHPKTIFPGKKLPPGVVPNTYLSRFIAFLPHPPYTIVARSGSFCLGYPQHGLDDDEFQMTANETNHHPPLLFSEMQPMTFGNVTLHCPRIHFVTGMTDVGNSKQRGGSVLISYGVSDCLSRVVEIPKSEIVRMLRFSFHL